MGLIPNRKTYDQSQHHLTMKSTRVLTTIDFEPAQYILGTRPAIRHETSQVIVVAPRR